MSAIIPKLTSGASGASLALPAVAAHERLPKALQSAAAPMPVAERAMNWRRPSVVAVGREVVDFTGSGRGVDMKRVVLQCVTVEIFAEEFAGEFGIGRFLRRD